MKLVTGLLTITKCARFLIIPILLTDETSELCLLKAKRKIETFEKVLKITSPDLVYRTQGRWWNCTVHGRHSRLTLEILLATEKRCNLVWFGHVTPTWHCMCITVFQSTLEGDGRRGGQRKRWLANGKKWTRRPTQDPLIATHDRSKWRALSAATSDRSPQSLVPGELV